ncbi:MAG: hypothetical protein AB7S81_05460 [Bdellovibrionales bacterium]
MMENDWLNTVGWIGIILVFFVWVRKKIRSTPSTLAADNQVQTIVQSFGETLEFKAPAPGCVADANELPYPKKQIKEALLTAIKMTKDPAMKQHLKVGYLSLADWQEGVGKTHLGMDAAKYLGEDVQAAAKQVLADHAEGEKWMNMSNKELQSLQKELDGL